MTVQIVQNWNNRKVVENIPISVLYDKLSNPDNTYKSLVDSARLLDRKSEEFRQIKASLPCFSAAFNFKGYVNSRNAKNATGYLYLDIDNEEILDLDHPSVVMYNKSLSGKGYSIIVGVIGLTKENLKKVSYLIAQELDVKIDTKAISVDRLTVLSYDYNTFYNPQHTYFLVEKDSIKNPHYNDNINYINSDEYNGGKIILSNLREYIQKTDFGGKLKIDMKEDKLRYAKLITPFHTVHEGRRSSTLNAICYQFRALNPYKSVGEAYYYMQSINQARFSPPLTDSEVSAITTSVYRIKDIEPVLNASVRFLYNPDYDLTPTEKRQDYIKAIHEDRISKTVQELSDLIESWDFDTLGKITQTKLTQVSKKNKKTVEKYYPELKQKISKLNLEFKKK